MFRPKTIRRVLPMHPQSVLRTQAQMDADARIRADLLRQASLRGALAAHLSTQRLLDQCAFLELASAEQVRNAFGTDLGVYEAPTPHNTPNRRSA